MDHCVVSIAPKILQQLSLALYSLLLTNSIWCKQFFQQCNWKTVFGENHWQKKSCFDVVKRETWDLIFIYIMQKGIKLRGKLQNNKGKSSHIISGKNKKMITVAK